MVQIQCFDVQNAQELAHKLTVQKLDSKGTKLELKKRLQSELGGIQRVPVLVLNSEIKTLSDMELSQYEIALSEPLHDYSNHVKNLLQEIPTHLSQKGKETFKSTLAAIFQGKNAIRGCDYRDAAVLPNILRQEKNIAPIPEMYIELLDTLREIGNIMYSREDKRSNQNVLHFYLVAWKHWLQLRHAFRTAQKLSN